MKKSEQKGENEVNNIINPIDITSIFEKVRSLDENDKMLLRRAWKIPFNQLRMPQKALLFNLIENDNVATYKMDFLADMMAIHIKQGCESGRPFEYVLKTMYDTGNAATKQKIGYMIDERDKRVFINYVTRYVELCSKENNIDIIKLASDVLNWSYKTKDEWIKTIAGISKEEKMEEKTHE